MAEMDTQPAYNMIINNGSGCGLYLDIVSKNAKKWGAMNILVCLFVKQVQDRSQNS
ncbi:hypothetical protein [Psychromonas hadalis]|uniref:hypothetical protein n=1 Tax=Psychromonas hadalis TaxID=211669 RepID=UPI0003B47720|nr:hypothetical protein [Psychromonas hadalis]